ncbi:MAG: hypothetical protein E7678_02605 [Ruminococcaceae bacterium]|nr:hypothetical protein [Oscillospiraceae bacterium]
MKKILKSIFFPHIAIVTLVTVLASLSLIYSLVNLTPLHNISILSYVLSAYALILIICAFPGLVTKFKQLKLKVEERRDKSDPSRIAQLKINFTLYGTFFYNSIYATFTLFLGLWHSSSWYLSIATYYILLAIMRFSLLYYSHSNKAGEDIISELKRFRLCGVLLLLMNTALSGLTFYQTIETRNFRHHGATAIALAIFTLSLFVLSIINMIKYRKFNSPVLFAAKLISFVSALVSLLSLETAIISKLGNTLSVTTQKLLTGISAFTVLAIICYIGIFMVVRGTKSIKALNKSEVKK